uniref:Modification methylase AplI n=1 Tax=Rhodoplanes serenus TaxID=200615 RepID=A0AAJ5NFP2_9BRAD|nr:Modification methylase AplI [Rhodoplanes serenus]
MALRVTYYNEIDPFAAAWLRNLISAGHITDGVVDERSIRDVRPADLDGCERAHFFAGIAGWDLALQLAGWPDDAPVWTGSCPCQPFSSAGRGRGTADDRHFWPVWFDLIRECRPPIIFGEQVAAAIRHGWLDLVFDDLEGTGYACRAAIAPACSVGAPHIRERLWWVAYADTAGRREQRRGGLLDRERTAQRDDADGRCALRRMGDAGGAGLAGWPRELGDDGAQRATAQRAGCWSDLVWLPCTDGKARPTQPGLQPLAHGATGRVGRLRAYGNAIVPQVAAAFISAAIKIINEARHA